MAARLYGVIDAARDPTLYDLIKRTPDHVCLFAGDLKAPLERTAPYLIDLTTGIDFARIWRQHLGESWGILVVSSFSLQDLRKHFRQFLQARLPNGTVVLFRFYDPRVFSVYFPTCDDNQRADWFSHVDEFRVETDCGSQVTVFRAGEHRIEDQHLDI